jgi:hypothetical protein
MSLTPNKQLTTKIDVTKFVTNIRLLSTCVSRPKRKLHLGFKNANYHEKIKNYIQTICMLC